MGDGGASIARRNRLGGADAIVRRGCSMACSRSIPNRQLFVFAAGALGASYMPARRATSIPLLRSAASKASQYLLFWVIFASPKSARRVAAVGIRMA